MNLLNAIGDRTMKLLLRSPLHGLGSGSFMLVTFSGRRSGRVYTIPVNYVRDGDVLLVVSYRHRTWWRNLRRGAPVTVRVKGEDLTCVGEASPTTTRPSLPVYRLTCTRYPITPGIFG
jgi:deazaflavin-dependent oxidoreductase (nitroreductase family)